MPGGGRGYVVLPLLVALALFWIAYDDGGYDLTSRNTIGVAAAWAIVFGLGLRLWPRARIPTATLVAGSFLAAVAAWTGLSLLWGDSAEAQLAEFDRAALYLALFALVVLVSPRGRTARRWAIGLAVGVAAVGILALVSRLFPSLFAAPGRLAAAFPAANRRLSFPVTYWNGLATLLALGVPFLLDAAVRSRSLVARGLAVAPLPAVAADLYLTSSRGGIISCGIAIVVFFALTSWRWRAAGAILVAAAGSAAAVAILVGRSALVDDPYTSPLAVSQGHQAAWMLALVCLATAAVFALGTAVAPRPPRLGRAGGLVLVGVVIAAVVALLVAAHPVRRFDAFKAPPPQGLGQASIQQHLFSGSGRGRWQLWQAAVREWKSEPLTGRGAGSYEAWWTQHGTLHLFVRDAHSLYLETLAELGIVGLLLLLGWLGTAAVVGVRRTLAAPPAARSTLAALVAALAAYLFEAGVDWMWEVTIVSLVLVVVTGLLVGPATAYGPRAGERGPAAGDGRAVRRSSGGARVAFSLAALAAAWALIVLESIPLLSTIKIDSSQTAISKGNGPAALKDAADARSLEPWASSPYLQIALVEEAAGHLPPAEQAIRKAITRSPLDWRLWLVRARLEVKSGKIGEARTSLDRAKALNPRSQLFRTSASA